MDTLEQFKFPDQSDQEKIILQKWLAKEFSFIQLGHKVKYIWKPRLIHLINQAYWKQGLGKLVYCKTKIIWQ